MAELCILSAQRRMRASKKVVRKKVTRVLHYPANLPTAQVMSLNYASYFWLREILQVVLLQARNRENQAIMPLRGKILNTWEVDSQEILSSQEVHYISVALGVDPGLESADNLRYHKICTFADADSDGLHIATLLCALFVVIFNL